MTTSASPRASSPRSTTSTPRGAAAKRLRRQCTTPGCSKVDAGGGFCVAHGGGKKCAFPGCRKGYQTGGFCRQHGGGARCQVEGCGKVDAGRGLCRAHGGGKRCRHDGCTKADVGGGFCTAHGGGRRCSEPGCTKIDQGGGKCRAHGGARRCRHDGCIHPARGGSGLCSDHGGAQLCAKPNCRRIAKAEGGKFCSGCAKARVKTEEDNEEEQAGDDEDDDPTLGFGGEHQRPMPPLGDMLSRNSMQEHRYGQMAVDTMEPFHAFVQAATSADITSPPQYSDDLHAAPPYVRDQGEAVDERGNDGDADPQEGRRDHGSCLDNGCSKSFGGRCNCKAGCTCCSRARAAEQVEATPAEETATTAGASTTATRVTPSFLQLQRVVVNIQRCNAVPVAVVGSMLKAIGGVRSVHIKLPFPGENAAEERANVEYADVAAILRCDPNFSTSGLGILEQLNLQYEVEENTVVDWSLKEVVVKVADMMCPGNCGRTVMNALLPIAAIHTANLVFDERLVVARGDMSAQQLCDAIEAVGFDPVVVAEMPLSKRFVFRVVDFASVHLMSNRLRDLLQAVEGVETVLFAVDRAEALVEATLEDAGCLLQAAHARGIMMVETQENARDIQTSPFDPTNVSRPEGGPTELQSEHANPSEGDDHVCDVKVCAQNGCKQYMVTIAHTAALAVGWSVPGCAMGWGGECTCGEQCKCAGCPEHNPLT